MFERDPDSSGEKAKPAYSRPGVSDEPQILRRVDPRAAASLNHPDLMIFCPGCECGHGFWVDKAAHNGARWSWNGSMERPTFNPSMLITSEYPQDEGVPAVNHVCHSFVRDGQIQFLGDCTHALANQTVPLPAF